MPTETPTNFAKLNQWQQDDAIKMEDFNQDNLKIDQAMADISAQNSVYTIAADYSSGFFIISGLPENLPDIFTVRFTAPADYFKGDRLRIGEQEMDILTTAMQVPSANAFLAGTVVSLDVSYINKQAFLRRR